MNNKILPGAIFAIFILVFGASFWFNREFSRRTTSESSGTIDREVKLSDQKREVAVVSTPIPTPTFPPYSLRVDDINESFIILVNDKGNKLRLTNNTNMIKVFRQKGNELLPASISDVKKGLQVTVKIVIPGKESHIILQ